MWHSKVAQSGRMRKAIPKGLYQRNGVWWYRPPQVAGIRPPRVSLGTRSLARATAMVARAVRHDAIRRHPGRMTMQIVRYLDSRRISASTRATHKAVLEAAAAFWGDPLVAGITRTGIDAWKAAMVDRGNSDSTIQNNLARMATFLSWLVEDGQIGISPMAGEKIRAPKATRVERFCTADQRDRLIAASPNERIRLVLMLGFYSGLRIGEIAQARPSWIRLWDGGGEIAVTGSADWIPKDREARTIPIGETLRGYLATMPDLGGGDFLLPGNGRGLLRYDPSHRLKILGQRCGIPWFSAHCMRRTFGTLHALARTPLHLIARWLGDDLDTVQRHYLGYSTGGEFAGAIDGPVVRAGPAAPADGHQGPAATRAGPIPQHG